MPLFESPENCMFFLLAQSLRHKNFKRIKNLIKFHSFNLQVIGEPCGYHGPYTFYKGIRISPFSSAPNEYENNCVKKVNCFDGIDRKTAELLRSNDTIIKSIKHEYDSESSLDSVGDLPVPRKYTKTDVKPRLLAEW